MLKKYEEQKGQKQSGRHGEHVNEAFVPDEVDENEGTRTDTDSIEDNNAPWCQHQTDTDVDSINHQELSQHLMPKALNSDGATETSLSKSTGSSQHRDTSQNGRRETIDRTEETGSTQTDRISLSESTLTLTSLDVDNTLSTVTTPDADNTLSTVTTIDFENTYSTVTTPDNENTLSTVTSLGFQKQLSLENSELLSEDQSNCFSEDESLSVSGSQVSVLRVDLSQVRRNTGQDGLDTNSNDFNTVDTQGNVDTYQTDLDTNPPDTDAYQSDIDTAQSESEVDAANGRPVSQVTRSCDSSLTTHRDTVTNQSEDSKVEMTERNSFPSKRRSSSPHPSEISKNKSKKMLVKRASSILSIDSYTLSSPMNEDIFRSNGQPSEDSYTINTLPSEDTLTINTMSYADSYMGSLRDGSEVVTPPLSPGACSFDSDLFPEGDIEVMVVYRLPGEQLGMGLTIEGMGDGESPVKGVFVDSVVPGGPADRATGSRQGIHIGDEILEVNGTPFTEMTHSETVEFFQAMPLRVILTVKRGARKSNAKNLASPVLEKLDRIPALTTLPSGDSLENLPELAETPSQESPHHVTEQLAEISEMSYEQQGVSLDNNDTTNVDPVNEEEEMSDAEYEPAKTVPEGFQYVKARLQKDPQQSLGLSIVPSYGSTKYYYQVRAE